MWSDAFLATLQRTAVHCGGRRVKTGPGDVTHAYLSNPDTAMPTGTHSTVDQRTPSRASCSAVRYLVAMTWTTVAVGRDAISVPASTEWASRWKTQVASVY